MYDYKPNNLDGKPNGGLGIGDKLSPPPQEPLTQFIFWSVMSFQQFQETRKLNQNLCVGSM